MKIAVKIFLLVAVSVYLVFALAKFAGRSEEQTCETVDIAFSDSDACNLVSKEYVTQLLAKHKIYAEGQKIGKIDMRKIESILSKDPFIQSASCYCSAAGNLCINVVPERPVLHIITKHDNYYIDRNGVTMPVGNLNFDLCIATGNITKDFAKRKLAGLAAYLHDEEFWDNQIEQIHVTDTNRIALFPRVGAHTIILGNTDNVADKMSRLELFYKKGLTKAGWNKYETIDLSFDGQVVCTKAKKHK